MAESFSVEAILSATDKNMTSTMKKALGACESFGDRVKSIVAGVGITKVIGAKRWPNKHGVQDNCIPHGIIRCITITRPHHHQIYWRWVGSIFALYVVLMATAAGLFVTHESTPRLAQQRATTVVIDVPDAAFPPTRSLRQVVRY